MTWRALRRWPPVILASPVLQPWSRRHSSTRPGPAARWMAPSTPPPPSNDELAALTMASTSSAVMSPCQTLARMLLRHKHPGVALHGHRLGRRERIVVVAEIEIHALPANAGAGVLRQHHARKRLPAADGAARQHRLLRAHEQERAHGHPLGVDG